MAAAGMRIEAKEKDENVRRKRKRKEQGLKEERNRCVTNNGLLCLLQGGVCFDS